MNKFTKLLFKILLLSILAMILYKIFPLIEDQLYALDSDMILRAIFLIALILFLMYGYSARKRLNNQALHSVLLWLVIFSILIVLYAFRFELESFKTRILTVLIPAYSWTNEQGQLVIARNQNGHFYLNAYTKNHDKIKFLVDTGASDIALTKEDAIKLGFNPDKLNYTRQYSTANGVSFAAPVRIPELTIGKRTFYNLEAHVASGGLDISLLGMSLIENFSDFKITKDMLLLSY